jgi:putative transposase
VSRYIESNPVRAGLVKKPEYYLYSSAQTHILGVNNPLIKESLFDKTESNEYRRLMKIDDKVILEDIRRQTRLGRPLGNGGFLETLSAKLDRSLVFRPKGRPRKKND